MFAQRAVTAVAPIVFLICKKIQVPCDGIYRLSICFVSGVGPNISQAQCTVCIWS